MQQHLKNSTRFLSSRREQNVSHSSNEEIYCQCSDYNYIGLTIQALRIERNITQAEAARKVKILQSTWSAIENGKTIPDLDLIIKISTFFKISPYSFLGKCLDKSRFYNKPYFELEISDFEEISQSIEKKRKENFMKKVKEIEMIS